MGKKEEIHEKNARLYRGKNLCSIDTFCAAGVIGIIFTDHVWSMRFAACRTVWRCAQGCFCIGSVCRKPDHADTHPDDHRACFHMGAAGAALAMVSAQAASVRISLAIIRRRERPFAFSLKDIRPKGVFIKEILKLGIPVALQDLLASISFLVILSMVNSLG